MAWTHQHSTHPSGAIITQLTQDGRPATWREVALGLVEVPSLREALTAGIVAAPFAHVFWECAPLTPARADQPFATALVDAAAHAHTRASPRDFQGHLAKGGAPVVRFPNLSGDARLIVPRPLVAHEHYGDLSGFLRGAPATQVHALWRAVGEEVSTHLLLETSPLWVSTAGLGAPWLHVRLDSRPKYYRFSSYRNA